MARLTAVDLFGLALGLFAAVSQVLIVRESMAVLGGNELSLAVALAGWLFGVGVGALAVGRSAVTPSGLSSLSAAGAAAMAGTVVLIRLNRWVLGAAVGQEPALSATLAMLFGVGLIGGGVVGALFTAGARSLDDAQRGDVGRLYVAESLGALLGGAAFSLLLSERLPHLVSLALCAVALFAASALRRQPRASRIATAAAGVVATVALASGWIGRADAFLSDLAFTRLRSATHLDTRETPYGRVSIGRLDDQYEVLVDGRFESSFPDPWERPGIIHFALTQHPNPESALIIGGGPSDRLAAALSHGVARVVLTHRNAAQFRMTRPFLSGATRRALSDPRVTVTTGDGLGFLRETPRRFDAVVLLAPLPLSAGENRYFTKGFFCAVRRVLGPRGVVTVRAPGGANVLTSEAVEIAADLRATLLDVFPSVGVVPGTTLMIHAAGAQNGVDLDPERLASRFARRVPGGAFSAERFREVYDAARVRALAARLGQIPGEINTESRPVVFRRHLELFERSFLAPGSTATITGVAGRWALPLAFAPAGLALLCYLALRRRRRFAYFDALMGLASTGAAGMGISWIVLHVFQSTHGTLYRAIALLSGLFMAGLALGALGGRRYLSRGRGWELNLVDGLLVLLLLLTGPLLSGGAASRGVLHAWALLAGVVTGAAFPVMLRRAAVFESRDERRSAAAIESADHFGAALGALVTGVVWVPALGVTAACLAFAGLKIIGMSARAVALRARC